MPSESTTLQRIRFSGISPTNYQTESFFKNGFCLEAWEQKGRACYWAKDSLSKDSVQTAEQATLSRDERLCSDSYFNAFFIAYWFKLTTVRNIGLRLKFSGRMKISIEAHSHLATTKTLVTADVLHNSEQPWEAVIPADIVLDSAIRLSFTVTALSKTAILSGGEWYTTDAPARPVSVAIVIPTFNRANYARKTITALLGDPAVESMISRIVVIEQSDKVELDDLAGGKCVHIRQGNLGGAGGFARGMLECTTNPLLGEPSHLLLMDDDIMIETDSVLRVVRMAEFGSGNRVLGGGMLDLFKPNLAVALGESNEINDFGFYALNQVYPGADVARPSTLNMAAIPEPVGYCAWWFCFFPIELVHTIGLPIPCFFRGDDIQFGGRAKKAGFEPYMIPGIGLWHLPFYSKSVPWVTYFDRYNTLVGNALHGGPEADRFFAYSVYEIRVLLARKAYAYAAAAVKALENYLRGWEHYTERSFPAFLSEVKTFIAEFVPADSSKEGLAKLKPKGDHLESRANAALARYQTQAIRLQQEFAKKMPQVYTTKAWTSYFRSGSMKEVESRENAA